MTTEDPNPPFPPVPLPEINELVTIDPAIIAARRQRAVDAAAAYDEAAMVAQVTAAEPEPVPEITEPPPPEHHEFMLAINPDAYARQLAYLETLQHQHREPLLEGLINFLRGLAEQAYALYGINATTMNEAELLQRLAAAWEIQPAELVPSVRASTELMIQKQLREHAVADQVAFLTTQWGPDATRRILQSKYQERLSGTIPAQEQAPVPASPQPIPPG